MCMYLRTDMDIFVVFVSLFYISGNILVQGQDANLARGKPADQADTVDPYTADKAVNGLTNNCATVFTHTATKKGNWWTVDLQRFVRNPTVTVFPRSNYYDTYQVLLGNFTWRSSPYKLCAEKRIGRDYEDFVCQGMTGRFVAVHRVTELQSLCLCEVEVRGEIVEKNRALGQEASQSSTYSDYVASRAVNGRRSGPFTHTEIYDPKWWQVDLKGHVLIYKFTITPRVGVDYGGNYSTTVRNSSAYSAPSLMCRNKNIPSATTEFNCSNLLLGRYAVVEFFRPGQPLCLHEVEVYGFCLPGYHRPQCNETCPANCEGPCDESTGNCLSCFSGSWGAQCEYKCGKCSDETCAVSNGDCLGNCTQGYYGRGCNQTCPQNCYQSTCQREDGVCLTCEKGFYGQQCKNLCPANCKGGACLKQDGSCTNCRQGFWDTHCTNQCGKCVNDVCNQMDAACFFGCKSGFYGRKCNNSCPENCRESICLQDNGSCNICKETYFGKHCNSTCSLHCASYCDKNTGRCDQCLPGTWGIDFCSSNCSNSCATIKGVRSCNRATGRCDECPVHFWGDKCDRICLHCSDFPCERQTGNCKSCRQGFHGKLCDKLCPANCSVCDQDTALCQSCTHGTHGEYCDKPCPSSCGGNKHCGKVTSRCFECPAGYHGDHCTTPCPFFCSNNRSCFQGNGSCMACPASLYGATCQETCGQGCMRGICDRDDGFCICLHDYESPKCQSRRLNVAAVGGGLGAVILILILLFVIMVIWLRTGRKLPCIETPQHFQNKGSYQDGINAANIPTVYEELDHIEPSDNAPGLTDGNRGGKSDAYTNITADYCELSPNKNHLQQHEYLALNVHKGSSIYQNQPEGGQLKRQENKEYEEIVNKGNIAH